MSQSNGKGTPMQERLHPELIERLNQFTDDFLSDTDNSLDKKSIELIAVAVSISVGCAPCTDFHIGEAKRCGTEQVGLDAENVPVAAGVVNDDLLIQVVLEQFPCRYR